MKINILRIQFNQENTLGAMSIGSKHIGYTIERPHISQIKAGQVPCIKEGEYEVKLRNNPIAGSLAVKVMGEYLSANTSIRCCVPTNDKNASITVVDSGQSKGDAKDVQPLAWTTLITHIINAQTRGEEVKLVIK